MLLAWFIGIVLMMAVPCVLALLGPKAATAKDRRTTAKGRRRAATRLFVAGKHEKEVRNRRGEALPNSA
jgi:hypothetical protein